MLIELERDFNRNSKHFEELYKRNFEDFINDHNVDYDNFTIDLRDKIVVSLRSLCIEELSIPSVILNVFIPEQSKLGYKASLLYRGHIAFLKIVHKDNSITYLYKDDECYPQSLDEVWDNGDIGYCASEIGYTKEDLLKQVENIIQTCYDMRFNVKGEDVIFLEGL